MKRVTKTILAGTLIAGLTAGAVYARYPGGTPGCGSGPHAMGFGHRGDPESRIERMAERLDLSKEQVASIRAIVDKSRPQKRELRDKLVETRKQLRALKEKPAFNESEVRRLADAQGRIIADMIVLRTKVQSEVRGVLTEQQRKQLQDLRGQRGVDRGA